MKIEKGMKEAFTVIGREGSTRDGDGFVQRLWQEANAHFDEIADLVKRDEQGTPLGFWGAMTDFSRSFQPWDHFNQGLYLAGAECRDDAEAPEGWVKWVVPGFEFLVAERESEQTFREVLDWMQAHDLPLAGAVQDFSCPETGKDFMMFPIRRL